MPTPTPALHRRTHSDRLSFEIMPAGHPDDLGFAAICLRRALWHDTIGCSTSTITLRPRRSYATLSCKRCALLLFLHLQRAVQCDRQKFG